MMNRFTYRAWRVFHGPMAFRLLGILIRKKLQWTISEADEKLFVRFSQYVRIQQRGIVIQEVDQDRILLSYMLDGRPFQAWIRRDASDLDVFDSVIMGGEYHIVVEQLRARLSMNRPIRVLDAGGNIGLFSLYIHHHVPQVQLIVIEPDSSNLALLMRNLQFHRMNDHATALQQAVWINDDVLELDNSFRDGKEWSLHVKASSVSGNQGAGGVKGITLDQLVGLMGHQRIDLFKMDIEGAERFLFHDTSFVKTVGEMVDHFVIEIHDEYAIRPHIYTTMEQLGYDRIESGDVTWFARSK